MTKSATSSSLLDELNSSSHSVNVSGLIVEQREAVVQGDAPSEQKSVIINPSEPASLARPAPQPSPAIAAATPAPAPAATARQTPPQVPQARRAIEPWLDHLLKIHQKQISMVRATTPIAYALPK